MAANSHPDFSLRWRWLVPVALLVVGFNFTPFATALNRAFFDTASRHPFRTPPLPENSAIVLVDDASLAALKDQGMRWPLPRAAFAALIVSLQRAGAERIILDFTFFDESEALEQDLMLAATAAAVESTILGRTPQRGTIFWPAEFREAHLRFFAQPREGNTEFAADSDAIVRRYWVAGSLAAGGQTTGVSQGGGLLRWSGGLEAIRARGVPVVPAGQFIVDGLHTLNRLSEKDPDSSPEEYAEALRMEPPLTGGVYDVVRGKVVFVGANASGTFDVKPLPIGDLEPGLLIHWTAWANLVTRSFITPLGLVAMFAAAALAGAIVLIAGVNRASLLPPLAAAFLCAAVLLAGAWMLLSTGWFLAPATPVAAAGLVLVGVVVENFWREQRRKREIQAMFGAYVDPGVVARLVRDPAAIALRGERRDATVFFSDLAGFTALSEKLADEPERMVEVVNAYLEETSECLHRHGAYVDKYIGDAVMAVLGAPAELSDHAQAACRASLEAQAALAAINARYAAPLGVKLEVRIGLNTGEMIVGNLGSSRKKQYTVMGDVVNLASRLEGANKYFGTGILLGEETAKRVQATMVTRPLARLQVKGKAQAIEVHTLHGAVGTLTVEENEFVAAYRAGYTACVEHRFAEALAPLSRALALRPDDPSTQRWHTTATTFTNVTPPPDWEPVVSLDSK